MKLQKLNKFNNPKYILAFIIILQIVFLLFLMNNKVCFFCDEIYSYSLSNSQYGHIFPPKGHFTNIIVTDKWLPGQFFKKYICTNEKNKFNLSISDLNNFNDSHPPLYNYLLHIICSFFPETFSKWYGFCINIVSFIFTQILLFVITKKILKSELSALLTCFLYGFSALSVDCCILIRVYSFLTFLCLLLLYLYIICLDFNCSIKRFISIMIVIIIGGLTHYHFYIYAFYLTLTFIIICLIKKNYQMFGLMSGTSILGVVLANSYYPYIFHQFNNSPRAEEAFTLRNRISPITNSLANMFQEFLLVNNTLSTYLAIGLIIIFSIWIIVYFIEHHLKETDTLALKLASIAFICFVLTIYHTLNYYILGYSLMIRFILPVCPVVALITVAIINKFKNVNLTIFISILVVSTGFFRLDFYYSCTNPSFNSYLEFQKIVKDNNVIIKCNDREIIQSICPVILEANKVYISYTNLDFTTLLDTSFNSRKTYLFCLAREDIKIDYKKIIEGQLWSEGTLYEVYELK